MALNALEQLKDAIKNRRVILIEYPPGRRLVEPYALGVSSKGEYLVRVFQIDGESASEVHRWWKLLSVAKIEEITPTDKTFEVRSLYERDDKKMAGGILVQI